MLVDCDHIMQRKVEIARQDRLMSLLPACGSQPRLQYPVIPNSMEQDQWGMGKCGVLQFSSNNLSNSAIYVLDQYRTLIRKCI